MADSYQQIGDIDNAMICLDKVLQNHSSDHIDDALIKKGLLHRKRGEADQSLIVFNEFFILVLSDTSRLEFSGTL